MFQILKKSVIKMFFEVFSAQKIIYDKMAYISHATAHDIFIYFIYLTFFHNYTVFIVDSLSNNRVECLYLHHLF